MSFYSYKNSGSTHCPCNLSGNEVFSGLNEKICIQVQRVYDSCLMQEQLKEQKVTLLSYGLVPCCNGSCGEQQENANTQPTMPITFESCRSTSTEGVIRNLSVERLCDRPCFGRVRCQIDVPIDILFTDAACREYIGRGMVTVDRDVLLSIPDESIVPYNIESMVSAICVSGTYLRNNVFELEICVTVVLKVLAKVEVLVPSYGYCEVPPCEEFADSVCDEFFGLYMLAFLLGRWIGTLLMVKFRPQDMLLVYALLNVVLCGVIALCGGTVGLYAMLAVSFFMSIMYPTQFSLALKDLGDNTKSGAAFLVMAIVGNACLPQLTAYVMHHFEAIYYTAYLIPLVCFLFCAYYGWKGYKVVD